MFKKKVKVTQSRPTLCNPMDYTVHGILQARILEWVFPSPGDLSNPGIKPRSPTLQIFYQLSHQGSPRILDGVGSLSLLQQIFLTRESNQDLLHCRQILYQLSYQGSQIIFLVLIILDLFPPSLAFILVQFVLNKEISLQVKNRFMDPLKF